MDQYVNNPSLCPCEPLSLWLAVFCIIMYPFSFDLSGQVVYRHRFTNVEPFLKAQDGFLLLELDESSNKQLKSICQSSPLDSYTESFTCFWTCLMKVQGSDQIVLFLSLSSIYRSMATLSQTFRLQVSNQSFLSCILRNAIVKKQAKE
jgi:hypothetical protein